MLYLLAAIQIIVLVLLILLLLRKPRQPEADIRLAQLLGADLPTQMTRVDARSEALDDHLRKQLADLRSETAASSSVLRSELITSLTTLGNTLSSRLEATRQQSEGSAERLQSRVQEGLQQISTNNEKSLQQLNLTNEKKLEEMRLTVDEKLQKTLHSRLTESFGQVTDQLTKVHTGLGEMTKLSAGVDDLSRIFSNVKSRGGFAEVHLEKLLEQVLAPSQYIKNANVKPNTQEAVEFAIRFPGATDEVLLPIDAKFPLEDWERLETAYDGGAPEAIEQARRAFDNAIRTEGKRICGKYINEPITTPYAIMFLPTEGLYAEVLRRDGLQGFLHQTCRVMVAGPSNLYALLTSFQLGFRILNLQKKGNEVWNVLAGAQKEFKTFEELMGSMEKQVGTVQNTIQKLGVRTRAINRTLRDVSLESQSSPGTLPAPAAFDGMLPMLAASEDEPLD